MSPFAAGPIDASYYMQGGGPKYQQQYGQVPIHPWLYVEPNAPSHFLKLPTELRQEIFRYLMPEQPIELQSSIPPTFEPPTLELPAFRPVNHSHTFEPPTFEPPRLCREEGSWCSTRATPLLNLLLGFNREIYHEAKDILYATATFIIHIDRDGVTFCTRRILGQSGPVGHDGGVYLYHSDEGKDIGQFIQQFPWTKIRNYQIDLVFGQDADPQSHTMRPQNDWQVEKFDIRDYVSVVVSGILSKSRRLDKLQVRARYLDARPRPEKALADFRLLIGPLKRLRCVKKPLLMGVFQHEAFVNRYCQHRHPHGHSLSNCIPPPSSDPVPIVAPGGFDFDNIATPWEETLALEAPTNIIPPSPLTQLFVRFKEFHDKLANAMPHIVRVGRQCFLHRARVAREREDIAGFRSVVAQMMAAWRHHVQLHDAQRYEVHRAMWRMMDADTYPGGRGAALQDIVENSSDPIKQWKLRAPTMTQET